MKTITFPQTNRVHGARQKLLLNELRTYFEIDIFSPPPSKGSMSEQAIAYADLFDSYLSEKKIDCALI